MNVCAIFFVISLLVKPCAALHKNNTTSFSMKTERNLKEIKTTSF